MNTLATWFFASIARFLDCGLLTTPEELRPPILDPSRWPPGLDTHDE